MVILVFLKTVPLGINDCFNIIDLPGKVNKLSAFTRNTQ